MGEGATEWAVRHNIDSLISEKTAQLYKHYKKKLDMYKMSVQQVSANTSARRKCVVNKMSDNGGCLNQH